MKTSIFLKSLAITTKIGINPDERLNEQTIFIDLSLQYDQKKVVISDDIIDALNYDTICQFSRKFAENNHFNLVETFIYHLAQNLFKNFDCEKIKIKVTKKGMIEGCQSYGAKGVYKKLS